MKANSIINDEYGWKMAINEHMSMLNVESMDNDWISAIFSKFNWRVWMFPSQQHWRNDADYSDNDSLARSTIYTRWMFQLCIHFEQQISNTPDHTCWLDIRIRSLSLSFQRDHFQLICCSIIIELNIWLMVYSQHEAFSRFVECYIILHLATPHFPIITVRQI